MIYSCFGWSWLPHFQYGSLFLLLSPVVVDLLFLYLSLCLYFYFYLYLPLANQRLSINYPPFVLQLGLGATEQKSHCLTSHQATSSHQTFLFFLQICRIFQTFCIFLKIFRIFQTFWIFLKIFRIFQTFRIFPSYFPHFSLLVFSPRLKFLQIIFPHTLHSDELPLEYCAETRFLFSRVNFHPRIARPL